MAQKKLCPVRYFLRGPLSLRHSDSGNESRYDRIRGKGKRKGKGKGKAQNYTDNN